MDKTEVPALVKHADVRVLLDLILSWMREILGEKLLGLYLYGSLVAGDFDYEISDIDLLAATADPIDQNEFGELEKMRDRVVKDNPPWENRLEIAYVSLDALKTFRTRQTEIAVISPGELFHFKEAGKDWLLNWYFVRENGVTLFGLSPETIIEPISKAEFLRGVREQAQQWREYIIHAKHSRPYQGYAILTLCRAFYAIQNGEQVSKKRAARWAQRKLPGYASLIRHALEWRAASRETNVNHEATFAETRKFVYDVIDRIVV